MSALVVESTPFSNRDAARSSAAGAFAERFEDSPNAPSIAFWNGALAQKWQRHRSLISAGSQLHSDLAFPTLPLRPGDHVLDVGCGFGESTLELAERVGPGGTALGIDCARPLLEIASRERRAAQQTNAGYLLADIETARLPPALFDAAVSRFGIMFCQGPVRALRNIRASLRPGGVLGLLCWRPIADNPCWALPEQVALRHLPAPEEPAATCGPGPYSFAAEGTNRAVLDKAGFRDVRHRRIDRLVCMGRDISEALAYQLAIGPAGFVVREAGERGRAARPAIERELAEVLAGYQRADGSVWMISSTWFVTARSPLA